MKINTILFDLDGVIIDSSRILTELHQKTAKSLGLRVPAYKEISSLWGQSWEYIINALWPGTDKIKFRKIFREIKDKEKILIPPVKGVENVLRELKGVGYKLGMVSACPKKYVIKDMKEAGVDSDFFEVIVSAEDTIKHKPNPDPILHACKLFNVKPENAIYIGDSIFDYKSAKNANVEFIAVLTGDVGEEEFRDNGVENIITSVAELPKFLKS